MIHLRSLDEPSEAMCGTTGLHPGLLQSTPKAVDCADCLDAIAVDPDDPAWDEDLHPQREMRQDHRGTWHG